VRFPRVRLAIVTAVVGSALVVTGCGPNLAGAAAVVGSVRITDAQVAAQVTEYQAASHKSGDTTKATQDTLRRLLIDALVAAEAAHLGVVITDGAVDRAMASAISSNGGSAGLISAAVQSGIPPSQIRGEIRTSLLVSACAAKIAPTAAATAQQTALVADVAKLAAELNTRVNPRFGAWDPKNLAITANNDSFLAAVVTPSPSG